MKKKLLAGLVTGIFMLGMGGMASAISIVDTGDISTPTEIDYWNLTLSSVSDVTINMLAYEYGGVDFFGNGNDNDRLDSFVYLLDNSNNVIGANDDSFGPGPSSDGSVSGLDSYLAVNGVAAGNYTIAVGAFYLSYDEVMAGANDSGGSSGLYQMTVESTDEGMTLTRGAGHSVPEPATLFLFGTGLAGLVGIRRKKK